MRGKVPWVWGCSGTPEQCCTCAGQCRVHCSAPPLVRCPGRGALGLAQPFGNAAPAPAHVLPMLAMPVSRALSRGSPASRGSAWPAAPAAAGRLSPPAKHRSRQRLPGSGMAGAAVGSGAVREGPRPRGRARPRWRRSPRPLVCGAARPCRPPAPGIVRRDPRPAARPVQRRPSLPPSSGRPCPSPLFSPKANGDEMQRVGPGRARRGRSVRPQSPPLGRWPVCGAAGGACQPRPAEWRRSAAGRCCGRCCCCCSRCQVSPRPIVRPRCGRRTWFYLPGTGRGASGKRRRLRALFAPRRGGGAVRGAGAARLLRAPVRGFRLRFLVKSAFLRRVPLRLLRQTCKISERAGRSSRTCVAAPALRSPGVTAPPARVWKALGLWLLGCSSRRASRRLESGPSLPRVVRVGALGACASDSFTSCCGFRGVAVARSALGNLHGSAYMSVLTGNFFFSLSHSLS